MKYVFFLLLLTLTLFSQDGVLESDISYFEQKDLTQEFNVNEVNFLPLDVKHSNFGFTTSVYWLKIHVNNVSDQNVKEVLHFPYTLLDSIDIYELNNNVLILQREYGDLREYVNDGNIPDPSFIITLLPQESKTFLYRVQTQGSMNIELLLSSYDNFEKYSLEKSIVFSFYFGALFIMLIYNLILYLIIKDRSYLYYLLFHIDYLFFSLSLNGISAAYLWPEVPFINTLAVPLLMSIGSALAVIFTIEFLDIKLLSPKLYKVLKTLFFMNIVMSILVLFLSYHTSSMLASFLSLVSILIILSSSLYSHFSSKNPYAKFFALAWGMLLMGILIIHFRNLGLLPVNILTSYSPLIGAFIELTLLSIALAYRYNVQQEELVAKDTLLYKQSRLASMGEMINNIAHQWRQPLHRINLGLAVIEKVVKEEKIENEFIKKKIQSSEKNIQYMSQTIDDFADFFRPDKKRSNFKVYDVVKKSLKLLESRLDRVTVHMPQDEKIVLHGFENEYIQVILVILNNAIDNFESKELEDRDVFINIEEDANKIILTIRDNGGGIEDGIIEYIFDPYFSTKFKKEGTGIGLYMAKMLIENSMHGELKVHSSNAESTFSIITEQEF